MFQRIVACLTILAVLLVLPVVGGCQKEPEDEVYIEQSLEVKDAQVTEPTEVVE